MENKNMKKTAFLLIITLSISLIIGQGGSLYVNGNTITNNQIVGSVPLTSTQQLSTATNLQEYWDQIPEGLRKSYLETYPESAAQKLSSDNLVEDFTWEKLTDPENREAWTELSKDSGKTLEVLQKKYGSQISGSGADFTQSAWGNDGTTGDKLFSYKGDSLISESQLSSGGGYNFNSDHITITRNGNQFRLYRGAEIPLGRVPTPPTVRPLAAQPASPCSQGFCPGSRVAAGAQAGAQLGAGLGPIGQSFGAGAGALSATGSLTPGIDQAAMQFFQTAGQAFQQIAGNIPPKDDEIPKPLPDRTPSAGESFVLSDPNSPFVIFINGEGELRENQIRTNGQVAVQGSNGQVGAVLAGLDGETGTFTGEGENLVVDNGAVFLKNQFEGTGDFILTPNGEPGNDPSKPVSSININNVGSLSPTNSITKFLKKYFPLNNLLTGKAISATTNTLKLERHDLDANGPMNLYQLKTFNNIRIGSGGNTNLFNGANQFQFEKQQTFTNTLFQNLPYGADIYNKLDRNNVITAEDYDDAFGRIVIRDADEIVRTSVTDIVTTANSKDYPQLVIAEHRSGMFQ